jgi:ribokinase
MTPSVVVVGSLNRDHVCTVDRLPGPGETRLGTGLTLWSGGKGGNQAVAAALVGADVAEAAGVGVAMVGAVGDDADGAALLAGLRAVGVDVDDVAVRRGDRSGAALITVAEDGENTIVVAPGANGTVEVADVRAVLRRRSPTVVVVQGELPPAVVAAAIEEAAALGARPLLNLAPVIPVDDTVLELCDPLVVNAVEAGALLGRTLAGTDDLDGATRELSSRARSIVVTGGGAGAWVCERGPVRHVPARPATVVDTTGAGDAFTGALAVGLAVGRGITEAAAWGAAVAAYAVGRPGAQASFPRGSEAGLDGSGPGQSEGVP